MTDTQNPQQLETQRDSIRNQLASIGDFRPGNLSEFYRKCGKPNCHCAKPGHRGPGPSWIITRKSKSDSVTRGVPSEALEQTRQQMREYKRFSELVKQMIEINEALCQARVKAGKVGKKGASHKAQQPRSPADSSMKSPVKSNHS